MSSYMDRKYRDEVIQQVEIEVKYEGYIQKAKRDAAHLHQMENVRLPQHMNYEDIEHLSLEAKQKLSEVRMRLSI